MILLIDNYDSFTYNLWQYLKELTNEEIVILRNDDVSGISEAVSSYSKLLISPGPGKPDDAGICIEIVKNEKKRPVLGVCLGHQIICSAYGVKVGHAKALFHGKKSTVYIKEESKLYKGIEKRFEAGRYHSLAALCVDDDSELKITSVTAQGEIMSVEHKSLPVYGVQFHPESILTKQGKKILSNFLEVGI